MLYLVGVLLFVSSCTAKITIDKIEPCEPNKEYQIKVHYKIKTENDMQVLEEVIFNSNVDMDDSIMSNLEIFVFNDDEWSRLITFHDTICHMQKKFMPEIELFEKEVGLTESCPYPKGEYKITNLPLDFEQFDQSLLPRGQMRIKSSLSHVDTDEILSCTHTDFTVED